MVKVGEFGDAQRIAARKRAAMAAEAQMMEPAVWSRSHGASTKTGSWSEGTSRGIKRSFEDISERDPHSVGDDHCKHPRSSSAL